MQYLTIWDFLLTPIYLLVLIAIAKKQRDKRYPFGHPLRRYYLPGLYAKLGGAIFITLVYQYYYGTGDTFSYFGHAKVINSALPDSISIWIKLLFRASVEENNELYAYTSSMFFYGDPPSYTVAAIAAFFGLFTGTTFIPIALIFAYFSFTGIWAMYRTFVNLYPHLYKKLAIAFLFIPSTIVWGSSVFKDTVCMFGLGWLTYTSFRVFINKDYTFKNLALLALSFYLVALVKVYIILAFLPSLGLWILMNYSKKLKSVAVRWVVNIMFIAIIAASFMFFSQRFAAELDRYSLEKIAKTAEVTRSWIGYVSEQQDGSAYDLGEFEPTLIGMLKKFPQAVVVTLYRPFIWETRKVIVLLSALEALAFMYFTFLAFKKRGIVNFFKEISKDPTLLFFLLFSLIFAFAVGISSYNFGSLSRYKIPCLPFFGAFLIILIYKKDRSENIHVKRLSKTQQNTSSTNFEKQVMPI